MTMPDPCLTPAELAAGSLTMFAPVGVDAGIHISCVRSGWQHVSDGKWIGWAPYSEPDSGTCPPSVEQILPVMRAAVAAIPESAWEPPFALALDGTKCVECEGNGLCGQCAGNGRVQCDLGEWHKCPDCAGKEGVRCYMCLGTGLSDADTQNVLVCGMDMSLPRVSLLIGRGARLAAVAFDAASETKQPKLKLRRPGYALAFALADGTRGILMPKTMPENGGPHA